MQSNFFWISIWKGDEERVYLIAPNMQLLAAGAREAETRARSFPIQRVALQPIDLQLLGTCTYGEALPKFW